MASTVQRIKALLGSQRLTEQDVERRIRERAHQIWLDSGQPKDKQSALGVGPARHS
jgi:hypothetical protein